MFPDDSFKLTDRKIAAMSSHPVDAERFHPVLALEEAVALLQLPVGTLRDWRSRDDFSGCCRKVGTHTEPHGGNAGNRIDHTSNPFTERPDAVMSQPHLGQGVTSPLCPVIGEGGNKPHGVLQHSPASALACKLISSTERASNQSFTRRVGCHRLLRTRFNTLLSQFGGGRLRDRRSLRRQSATHEEACRCI